jgi:hypothetical protein
VAGVPVGLSSSSPPQAAMVKRRKADERTMVDLHENQSESLAFMPTLLI